MTRVVRVSGVTRVVRLGRIVKNLHLHRALSQLQILAVYTLLSIRFEVGGYLGTAPARVI